MAEVDTGVVIADIPAGFSGWIWTNRFEVLGPAVDAAQRRAETL